MELTRMESTTDSKVNGYKYWPRGKTFGDLLAEKARQGVQVRMLLWYDLGREEATDAVISMLMSNPSAAAYKASRAALAQGIQRAVGNAPDMPLAWKPMPGFAYDAHAPRVQIRNAAATTKDVRSEYARSWWSAALSGEISNLEIRTRKADPARIKALKKHYLPTALSVTEEGGIDLVGTHHQKPILIDYHKGQGDYQGAAKAPPHTCGYVMGLNSVTDYWDTHEHLYNDPRRETAYEAGAPGAVTAWHVKPYRDYAIRVEGQALACLNKNFCEAWDKADTTHLSLGSGSLLAKRARLTPVPKGSLRAQIVRTQPEHNDATILKTYTLASAKAQNYIYIENQYVHLADWVKFVKNQRTKVVDGYAAGLPNTQKSLPHEKLPATVAPLFLFVVMPQAERNEMVPATYDTLAQMGQATTVRGYAAQVQDMREGRKDQFGSLEQMVLKDTLKATPSTSEVAAELDRLGIYTLSTMLMTYDYGNEAGKLRISKRDNAAQQSEAKMKSRPDDLPISDELAWNSMTQAVPAVPPKGPAKLPIDVDPTVYNDFNIKPQRYREIYIHSKLMLVDDHFITLGSANLNKRSMVGDSELNIACAEHPFAMAARQKVWGNLAGEDLNGGDGSPLATKQAFDDWTTRAAKNASNRAKPSAPAPANNSFIHTYDDPRGTPMARLA
jgi:phosphatidylserine/phosphatidylglycerophosphate/cardiolipin synthase-like enzyme